jgi:hypothetical protein
MNKSHLLAAALLLLMNTKSHFTYGQVNSQKFEIGAGISSFIFQGDLTPERLGSSKTMRFGINLYGSRIISPAFSLRTNLAIGGLRGDDAKYKNPEYRQQRSFNFRTPVIEVSQLLVWNPLAGNYKDKGFYPYLFGGIGISLLKIKRDWSNYNAEYFNAAGEDVTARLALDTAHALPRVIPVIPLGAGIRYNLSQRLALNLEGSYRMSFTDYLDGFSQAANPARNDHYHTITISAVYRIGKRNTFDCPVVKY